MADVLHTALHEVWHRIHVGRFDGGDFGGQPRPEYVSADRAVDTFYAGAIRAERVVADVAREHGITRVSEPPASTGPDQIVYVVGFAFDQAGRVALIRKNRPAWQAGRLNGIGGKVEPGERPENAMSREFLEETGLALDGWDEFVDMDFPGARIHFYRLLDIPVATLGRIRTTTDEQVVLGPPPTDQRFVIPNLLWLLPLAAYTADRYEPVKVHAQVAESLAPTPTEEVAHD